MIAIITLLGTWTFRVYSSCNSIFNGLRLYEAKGPGLRMYAAGSFGGLGVQGFRV